LAPDGDQRLPGGPFIDETPHDPIANPNDPFEYLGADPNTASFDIRQVLGFNTPAQTRLPQSMVLAKEAVDALGNNTPWSQETAALNKAGENYALSSRTPMSQYMQRALGQWLPGYTADNPDMEAARRTATNAVNPMGTSAVMTPSADGIIRSPGPDPQYPMTDLDPNTLLRQKLASSKEGPSQVMAADSPVMKAALELFDQTAGEELKNRMSIGGLGRSNIAGRELAKAKMSMMLPLLQDDLARQERTKERELGALDTAISSRQRATEWGTGVLQDIGNRSKDRMLNALQEGRAWEGEQLGREERGIARGQQAIETELPLYMDVAARRRAQESEYIGGLWKQGGIEQEREDAYNSSIENERLRLQALLEQSLYNPLGNMIPSTFGAKTSSSGLGK